MPLSFGSILFFILWIYLIRTTFRMIKAQYHKAEDYIPKFICYLQKKDLIKNNRIKKELARNLFSTEFKNEYNITQFSFAKMFSYLKYFNLITYDKDTNNMIFREDILDYVTPETNIVNRKKFNIIKILKVEQNSTIDPKLFEMEGAGPSEKEKRKTAFTRKECNVCNTGFNDVASYRTHQETEMHRLRMKYVSKKDSLTNSFPGITFEVVEGHGGGPEDVIVRKNTPNKMDLNIVNQTSEAVSIINIREVNEQSCYVFFEKISLPHVIRTNEKLSLKLSTLFPETIFYEFPVIITLKGANNDKPVEVLKELMFHVHSQVVDDLHSTEPYKKPSKPDIQDGHHEIIPGEMPSTADTDFKPLIRLLQYRLPNNIVVLLNNNLQEFSSITSQQSSMLKIIRNLLDEFSKQNITLNKANYFKICQLFLFMEEHQLKINIRNYDVDNQQLTVPQGFPKNCLELVVPGLAESRPSLLRGDSVFITENKQSKIKYEGIVHKINLCSVILGFSKRFINNVYSNKKKYSVSFGFNRVTLRAEHQAIELVRQHNAIPLLCANTIQTRPLKIHHIVWQNRNILNNRQQQQAVQHILSETSRPAPYLIFGPPGTGKTVTVVEAILQIWLIKPNQNILVCAPSNYAADEIAKRLVTNIPKTDLLRYVAPSYNHNFIDDTVKPYINFKDDYYHPPLSKLLTYRIIITTLVTASRLVNAGTPAKHFSYVFIDESGQATESETLIPIAGILTATQTAGSINGQIVLAGDPKQLGPIIQSQKATEYGYGISMLERLMNTNSVYKKNDDGQYNKDVLTKLIQCYRSHPAILEVPNKLFYDGELTTYGDKTQTHMAMGWEHLPNKNIPVIFHCVNGRDSQESTSPSFFNLEEIDVVIDYLEKLINCRLNGNHIEQQHIGIITPYRKQVQKLKQACQVKGWRNLMIGTVEQFQGQEKTIIIVSTVRCKPQFTKHDATFHLGFLRNPKRFNVAITRARALLIVVGNSSILQHDANWNEFIKYCEKNKCIVGSISEFLPLNKSLLDFAAEKSVELEETSLEAAFSRGNA